MLGYLSRTMENGNGTVKSKGSIMVVSKYVTLSQITDILCAKLDVDQDSWGLKLEVHYRVGSPWFPIIEIKCDEDLSLFISESSKTKLPLCVTAVLKDNVSEGVGKDEISPDIEKESPHGRKDDIAEGVEQDEINPGIEEESPEKSPDGRKDNKAEKRLFNAIKEGDWVKAREIVNTKEVTWTSKLNDYGHTSLHFAISRYRNNEVVKEILMGINSEELLTIVDNNMSHPAHHAAAFGNTEALKIMLESNPKCLFTANDYGFLPIHCALFIPAIKTFLYLFKQMKSYKVEYDELCRSIHGLSLLHQVLDAGLIDVAYELINDYPSLATTVYEDKTALECIIRKPELFYSGTSYSFNSRFVYHNMSFH